MDEVRQSGDRTKVAIPIRVRGMSTQNKFFDEQTETIRLGPRVVATRLRSRVDLETEVYVLSLKTNVGGTFRVMWVNALGHEGCHEVGLELIEAEGDLWPSDFPAAPPEVAGAPPEVWLECQRCHQRLLTPVPEADPEFLYEGFVLARACERCKATTAWQFTLAPEAVASEAELTESGGELAGASAAGKAQEDLRKKGRAPINLLIKVIRQKYGTTLEEICETENVSRTGAYFLTSKNYDLGEQVKVILPYKEGDLSISVPARVVRQDEVKGSFQRGVAIELLEAKKS